MRITDMRIGLGKWHELIIPISSSRRKPATQLGASWLPLAEAPRDPQEIETVTKGYKTIFELSVAAGRPEPDYAYGFLQPAA